jgi:transcriptional regulator with XRE-family HTH domain
MEKTTQAVSKVGRPKIKTGVTTPFQKNMVSARKRMGWTQEQASARMGVKRGRLGAWEEGRCTPDIPTLNTICKTYRIADVGDFLFGEFGAKGIAEKELILHMKYSRLSKPLKNLVDVLLDNPKLLE